MQKEEKEVRKKVKLLKGFYIDIVNFFIVNSILILIWFIFDKTGTFWPKFVILIWGVLLVFKSYRSGIMPLILPQTSFLSQDWEEGKVREVMRKQNRLGKSPPPPTKDKKK